MLAPARAYLLPAIIMPHDIFGKDSVASYGCGKTGAMTWINPRDDDAARLVINPVVKMAWKLDDGEVAAVASFVRNDWGNAAPLVSPGKVAKLRRRLGHQSSG